MRIDRKLYHGSIKKAPSVICTAFSNNSLRILQKHGSEMHPVIHVLKAGYATETSSCIQISERKGSQLVLWKCAAR